MSASQSKLDPRVTQGALKLSTMECGVVVSKDFLWWISFVKH